MEVKWYIILATAVILSFIIGFFLGGKFRKTHYDGRLVIGTIEDRDQFQFIFTTELEDLQKQDKLIMQIVNTQNSQPL